MRTANDALRSVARYVAQVLDEVDERYEIRLAFEEVLLEPPFAVIDAIGDERTEREGMLAKLTQPFTIQVYPMPQEYVEASRDEAQRVKQALWDAFERGRTYVDHPSGLAVPAELTATPSHGPGSIKVDAYYYRVTALDASGESFPTAQLEAMTWPSRESVTVTWAPVAGATGYRVYRGTVPGALVEFFEMAAPPFVDTGGSGTIGSFPEPITSKARRVPLYDYDGIDLLHTSYARNKHDFMRVEDHSEQLLPDAGDARKVRVAVDLRCSWRRVGRVPSGRRASEPGRLRIRLEPS